MKLGMVLAFLFALVVDKHFRQLCWSEAWEWTLHFHGHHDPDCDVGGVCEVTGGWIY